MKVIEIIDGGILTTVQDLGRYGFQRYGVPVSGGLDQFALRAANIIVGNLETEAGLETTLAGLRLRFIEDTVIAITGADITPQMDGQATPGWRPFAVPEGAVLSFDGVIEGMRAYVAVAGGIDVPQVLGSRSTYTRSSLGGLEGRALLSGDILHTPSDGPVESVEGKNLSSEQVPAHGHNHTLRVVMGPQDDAFTQEGILTFLSSTYEVSPQSDRIGYRLQGPAIQHISGADIVSDGIPLGAVQVTGDGMPVVLLADRGTTGGYAKIATVITTDIPRLAQAAPGDTITFQQVSVEDAHVALREQEEVIQRLKTVPPTIFSRRRYQAVVNGATHQVLGSLGEVTSQPQAEPGKHTISTTTNGETRSFQVDIKRSGGGQ
jgi:antagonist of KipI